MSDELPRQGLLAGGVVEALWLALPEISDRTVAAVVAEVAEYTSELTDPELANLRQAVRQALAAFLRRATRPTEVDIGAPAAGLDAAYALGRGEARGDRTMDPLLSAYRVGARAAWRECVAVLHRYDASARDVGEFAELVFTYIDELSAASVAGHADELAASGRAREKQLDRLGRALLAGEPPDRLIASAEQAKWAPPETLTAVLVPSPQVRGVLSLLDPRTLVVAGDVAIAATLSEDSSLLFVPDAHRSRARLLQALDGHPVIVGPSRPWSAVAVSVRRVEQAVQVLGSPTTAPIDTDEHLVEILLGADPEILDDLRAQVLAPLAGHRAATAERLAETLRSWLLHQGRREDVANHLHVHPQTVRYRMTQIREAYGDRLASPDLTLQLVVALASLSR
jgi:hypothetical protein